MGCILAFVLQVPVSLISFHDDCSSVSSAVTLDCKPLPDSDTDSTDEHCVTCESEQGGSNCRVSTSQLACHVCDSHIHHQNQIDKLLGDWKAGTSASARIDENFRVEFVSRFKVLLQGLEDDGHEGASIFYHACKGRKSPNPTLTVAKLIRLFDVICQISDTLSRHHFKRDIRSSLPQLLFRPWRKSSPKDCGVIIQMLRLASFEIINSREDFAPPENPNDIDRLVAVTFGLQALQTMARNTYSDAKAKFRVEPTSAFGFLDQPLESHKMCIKRNCQMDRRERRPLILCKCGVRFHKGCLGSNQNADDKAETICPSCKATSHLLDASRDNKLSDVYSLIVENGASALQPLPSDTMCCESAIHVAIRSNNYDLASMLLFGSYLLLNCDDSLRGWDVPEIAWGKDNKLLTPFKSGIDAIIKNMDMRPPVEILLLLCGRGAKESPEHITQALDTRHRMMVVMKGLDDKQALLRLDISMGLEQVPIPFVGKSGSLPAFMYVTRYVESRSTAVRWFDCRCRKYKQLLPFGGNCTSNSLKILHQKQRIKSSWKTYCNYLCECRGNQLLQKIGDCNCQLAENGLHHGLEVFDTSDGRGFGVRTAKGVTIKKHEIICHYSGEIITSQEAKRRDEYYAHSHKGSYILDMDEKGQYCIDATTVRSAAALINHSCSESNCELFRALGNHLDADFPYLGLCAKKDIGELTELQFNYIKGSSGEKPTSFCLECLRVHCLCQQCTKVAHGM